MRSEGGRRGKLKGWKLRENEIPTYIPSVYSKVDSTLSLYVYM